MNIRFFLKQVACLIFFSFFTIATFAQQTHLQPDPFKSNHIIVHSFEWTYNETLKAADVQISITNKSELEIKSVEIYLTAEDKKGIMLQSNRLQTLRARNQKECVLPEATKTLLFPKAFTNNDISTLTLHKVTIEYANGSLEILQ